MAPKEPIEGKAAMRKNLEALPPMTRDEKYICIILSALVIFLLTYQIHHIPMVYGFIFTAIIFYLPYVNIGTNNDIKNHQLFLHILHRRVSRHRNRGAVHQRCLFPCPSSFLRG